MPASRSSSPDCPVPLHRYLSAIDQLKLIADESNRERRILGFLNEAANPRRWNNLEYGTAVAMETPDTKRARQLRDLYLLLKIPDLEVDERLDALLQVKTVVGEFSQDKLCQEILDLIQREADLIGRKMSARSVQGKLGDIGFVLLPSEMPPPLTASSLQAYGRGC